MLPVLHLYDNPDRIADAAHAANIHGRGTVLRLGSETNDPDDAEAEKHLPRLSSHSNLATEQCHLVLDLFEVRSERDLSRAEPVVRKCVAWAQRYAWSSVTLAAGAMPESISKLPVMTPTPVKRWDLRLWQRVHDLGVRFGDYGIAHPRMARTGWAMPSLRYTDDDVWWIYRWPQDKTTRAAMPGSPAAIVSTVVLHSALGSNRRSHTSA